MGGYAEAHACQGPRSTSVHCVYCKQLSIMQLVHTACMKYPLLGQSNATNQLASCSGGVVVTTKHPRCKKFQYCENALYTYPYLMAYVE